MDEIRPGRVEAIEIESLEQGELLERDQALRPGPGLQDAVTAVVEANRLLDGGLPSRHILPA